jgi:hypothetical protein
LPIQKGKKRIEVGGVSVNIQEFELASSLNCPIWKKIGTFWEMFKIISLPSCIEEVMVNLTAELRRIILQGTSSTL